MFSRRWWDRLWYITVLFFYINIHNNSKYIHQIKNSQFPNLFFLKITNCSFDENHSFIRNKLEKLQLLDLSLNPINSLQFFHEIQCYELRFLDISSTKITSISVLNVKYFKKLERLFIVNCKLIEIDRDSFKILSNLQVLLFNNTFIENDIGNIELSSLKRIRYVKSDYFKLCCLFLKYEKESEDFNCNPSYSEFRSCSDLINTNLKKILYWIFGVLGCLWNFSLILLVSFDLKNSKVFIFNFIWVIFLFLFIFWQLQLLIHILIIFTLKMIVYGERVFCVNVWEQ